MSHEYDRIGTTYRTHRRTDPRIAQQILTALADANSILNVGAGAGSYEPVGPQVIAVEPSATMIRQRPRGSAPCVQASSEALPFDNASFDAAMAVLTIHHWSKLKEGLREMRRVARHRVLILTWDPDCTEPFWLTRDYLPEILAMDRARFPSLATLEEQLGPLRSEPVSIPWDCADGFRCAYWKRPHSYLDPGIQETISSFAQLDPALVARAMPRLAADLQSGEWDRRNGDLKSLETFDCGYRLVVA